MKTKRVETDYLLIGFTSLDTSKKVRLEMIDLLGKGINFISVADSLEEMSDNIIHEIESFKEELEEKE